MTNPINLNNEQETETNEQETYANDNIKYSQKPDYSSEKDPNKRGFEEKNMNPSQGQGPNGW